jgi:hypothetical protein
MDTPRDERGSEDEAQVDDMERSVIDDAGVNNDGDGGELEETE